MLQAASQIPSQPREAASLRELTPRQWKSGVAAWLGWLFDGLDMHLYTLVAATFVGSLINQPANHPDTKIYSSWIQAAFLVGWALGGGFFGRIGDKLGRSRALSLTILTYAMFTGLSFFVHTWWQLLICRFVAALGIGGEWAVGASLLSETWPRKWRPWIAAVLQTGVNVGVLLACAVVFLLAFWKGYQPRYVFLAGVLPALIVYWIRRHVPEPDEWSQARASAAGKSPGVADLFRGKIRRTTFLVIGICAFSLTGWWAFMFWHVQYLQSLPEVASWTSAERQQLVSRVFFVVIAVSSFGNFAASALAKAIGYRRAICCLCVAFGLSILGSFIIPRDHTQLLYWFSMVGFCSGVFGLFTMYLPPLFPTLLRTTGAGFCYNIGRISAAFGTVFFGLFSTLGTQGASGGLRHALLVVSFLFLPAAIIAWFLPELPLNEDAA
jgi:MFS family permease